MKDGFVKVGCTSFNLEVGNVNHNTNEIIKCLNKAKKSEVKILVFPELCISGYTVGDLVYQDILLESCLDSLERIKRSSLTKSFSLFNL